jgi:hypothetical protein
VVRGVWMGLFWLEWFLVDRIPMEKKCGAKEEMLA